MGTSIELGRYRVLRRMGTGGMGEVWQGLHVDDGRSVALKVLAARVAADAQFTELFHDEVRAIAALDHPHVIQVYDYGRVPPEAEAESDGALIAGSPLLVMEYAAYGDVHQYRDRMDWSLLHRVLADVLDGLAHAHARGIVHRDLKPANILAVGPEHFALTDFGLAHVLDPREGSARTETFGGTPSYMAPEQCDGRWRDYGPWTDLYALGCTAWSLVTGTTPFGRLRTLEAGREAHLSRTVPELVPTFPVPADLEGWLRRLLEKEPERRFRRAADAAWALKKALEVRTWVLPSEVEGATQGAARPTPLPRPDGTQVIEDSGTADRTTLRWASVAAEATPSLPRDGGSMEVELPPLPSSWEPGSSPRRRLPSAGLGLVGVRVLPLVDRETERSALWRELVRVRTTRSPGLVVLRGPSGYGKTRLADWLGERADEVGAAVVLRATHAALESPTNGLSAMFERHLRCHGLSWREVGARVQSILHRAGVRDPKEWRALAGLVARADEEPAHIDVRIFAPEQAYARMIRELERVVLERPVLLILDDVQWGAEALAFARRVLTRASRLPALIVVTVQEEALAERPTERAFLDELCALAQVEPISVGPLPTPYRRELVRRVLGLQGALADRVEEHTAGNPMFAAELVGDWVARGLLRGSASGFRLAEGTPLALPADLHNVWSERVDWLLRDRRPTDAIALEVAAVLGVEVDRTEWEEACAAFGVPPSAGLVDALLGAALIGAGPRGPRVSWSFVHGMLRESLVQRARTHGRLETHHAHIGATLAATQPAAELRIGRHLLAGRAFAGAVEPLLQAARRATRAGNNVRADSILDDAQAAMEELRLHEADDRWPRLYLLRSSAAYLRRDAADMDRWASLAETACMRAGALESLAKALGDRSHAASMQGRVHAALELAEQAVRAAEDHGAPLRARANALRAHALMLTRLGRLQEAETVLDRGFALLEGLDEQHPSEMGSLHRTATLMLDAMGRLDEALQAARRAEELYTLAGDGNWVADARNLQGELYRHLGQTERAHEAYLDALRHYEAMGIDGQAVFPRLNLAVIDMERGAFRDAERGLRAGLAEFAPAAHAALVIHGLLLACCASAASWDDWDVHMEAARSGVDSGRGVDIDVAVWARRAGDAAATRGQPDRARQALELARAHYAALGRDDMVRACDEDLERLEA